MNILSREAVRKAVERAMLLGGTHDEAIASAAASLHLPLELVQECVELELEGASDSEGGEPV